MAGKPIPGDGLPANLAGMTKNQLYDIMSQMKTLIEQNKQQAREILIQNPLLTKALFQAQIMLGMVQPPQVIPNIQPAPAPAPVPAPAQQPQQSAQPSQQSVPGKAGLQEDQTGIASSHPQPPIRKQQHHTQTQPPMPISSPSAPPVNILSLSMPSSHPLQPKGHMNHPMSVSQSSQLANIPPPHSLHSAPPLHQPQLPTPSNQLQQPLHTTGIPHLPLQPPMPPQARPPPSMPSFHHQYGPNMGFQHNAAPQHPSQSMFHSGNKPQSSMGPSFPQGQPPLSSQPPPQSLYQAGGSHLGSEFNPQVGSSMQVDRGSTWMSGPPESSAMPQLPGPPPLVPGQIGPGNQPSRSAPLTPEMEKALLQQVMSLTPEQINLLPPEQRNQVLQLQQMLRQ